MDYKDITIQELSRLEIKTFWDRHIQYLVEDEIISDDEDISYFRSEEYRGTILNHLERKLDRHHLVYFIYKNQAIGAASYCIYHKEGKCFILDFWIFKEYRGKGTGHICYEVLEEYTKTDGAVFYELNSSKENSIRFWLTNGYKENGKDEYGEKLFIKI